MNFDCFFLCLDSRLEEIKELSEIDLFIQRKDKNTQSPGNNSNVKDFPLNPKGWKRIYKLQNVFNKSISFPHFSKLFKEANFQEEETAAQQPKKTLWRSPLTCIFFYPGRQTLCVELLVSVLCEKEGGPRALVKGPRLDLPWGLQLLFKRPQRWGLVKLEIVRGWPGD